MTCQHHTAALIDIAASGSEPNSELRAHLQSCPSCSAAFQRERNLFASIDSTLRASANAEVPTAFVQRVRAVVNQQSVAPRLTFFRPRPVFAVAAAAIILFFAAYSTRRAKLPSEENSTAQHHKSPPNALPPNPPVPPQNSASSRVPPSMAETRRAPTSNANLHKRSPFAPRSPKILGSPEVLVSDDQEIILARYADQLRHRSSLPTLAAAPGNESDLAQTTALQLLPIQIAQLDVKPLEERHE